MLIEVWSLRVTAVMRHWPSYWLAIELVQLLLYAARFYAIKVFIIGVWSLRTSLMLVATVESGLARVFAFFRSVADQAGT